MQNLMPPIDTTDHAFHDGDPTTGQLGTIVTAVWLNDVQGATRDIQAEIIAVLTKAGIQPNPQKQNQLAEAISQIIGSGGYATSGDLTLGLSKKIDKADIAQQLGNDTTKVPSLQLVTTELGKKASVADANSKLAKDKNGADIPDKEAFIGNLGLPEKYQPKGNYQPAGDYPLASTVFCVGQRWYGMTSQRKLDTVYKNNTGKGIYVSVCLASDGVAGLVSMKMYVEDVPVGTFQVQVLGENGRYTYATVSAPIPAGSSYYLTVPAAESKLNINSWSELR